MSAGADEEMRRRVREQYGDGIPPDPRLSFRDRLEAAAPAAPAKRGGDRAVAQAKRARTGRKFEEDLDETHRWLETHRMGLVLPHYPPTVWRQKPRGVGSELHYRAGGGPCDYSGHVNLAWNVDGSPPERTGVPTPAEELDGRLTWPARPVPVVFDAKVLGPGHASYVHDPDRIGQLDSLAAATASGAVAFLLVRADEVGLVFLLSWREHRFLLARRVALTLFEKRRAGTEVETRLGRSVSRPKFETVSHLPCVSYRPGLGWPWWERLPALL